MTIASSNYEEEPPPPPLYTYVNTITAGIYDEQEDFELDPNAPPSYNAIFSSSSTPDA